MNPTLQWSYNAALVGALVTSVVAQDTAGQAVAPAAPAGQRRVVDGLESILTLEDVRSKTRKDVASLGLNSPVVSSASFGIELGDEMVAPGMGNATTGIPMPGSDMEYPANAKQLLLQHIYELRKTLKDPDQNRGKLEGLLREVLVDYFMLDMQSRVQELDKVKARVMQMESKLQARLEQRHELVELQIKQMLYNADGLDFSVPENNAEREKDGAKANAADGDERFYSLGTAPKPAIEVPGYDIRFGMTRYARIAGNSLDASDPLNAYLALDNKSDKRIQKPDMSAADDVKLKALLLAMYNFNDLFKHLPAPANVRAKTEQPHSWRVALLPILGYAELYKQYRFDEPWDSDSNQKLLEKMPAVFGSQHESNARLGMTRFQMLVGNGAAFDASGPTRLQDITDGTANTIALAVASASVPWTKPADIKFVSNKSLAELAPSRVVGLCNGRVETLPVDLTEEQLTALATRSGGEPQ